MNELPREKATHRADLPHQYTGVVSLGDCDLCHQPAFDERHLAWELAREHAAQAPVTLPRETGV